MFDYFYGQSGEMFSYFRVPKILFRDIKFKDLSTDAKTLYGILLDRMGLSVKNGWLDEQGRVYIIFPVQEVMDALGCADNKATKLFRELEKFGLIERKRRGLGKPNLIYVKNFADPRFRNREKNGSGAADSAQQETAKSRGNKTEWNKTEGSEPDPFSSDAESEPDERTRLEAYFMQSLEVDLLLRVCPDEEDTIDQIVNLLVDTCSSKRRMLRVAGDDKPTEVVRSRFMKLNADHLSGTPFRALNSGEFIEEQIYNWTYSDEQRAKENWQGEHNPYAALPRMVMMTYKIPESIQQIAKQGEYDEFDLNVFFSAKGKGRDCRFVYEDYVQKWLDLIRGSYLETTVDELKLGAKKPALPFADSRLLNVLQHTLWFLPNVASCYAMANLLADRKNTFYHDYRINVCAGTEAGIGAAALEPVQRSMGDPLATKTITLSCGKLTTGVTVKPWTGIFMLRNLSSPETYFQAAFRVQSPWEVTTDKGRKEIIKKECYVFDFALNRALRQISDYSCRLNIHEGNPEKKVAEFINFLPVIAYDGSSMRQINAGDILDIAMAGTSATLLAKRAAGERGQRDPLPPHRQQGCHGCSDENRGLPQPELGHRNHHRQVRKGEKSEERRHQRPYPEAKEGAFGRGKRVQVQAQADSGKAHQVCHPHSGVHVSDRLPGALPEGRDHTVGAGLVQEGHRSVGEGL